MGAGGGRTSSDVSRPALSPPLMGAEIVGIVGRTFEGRKAVVDVLTGGHDDGRGGGRGGAEACALNPKPQTPNPKP